MDYVDSISASGWGKLLATFVPATLWILIFDLIVYLVLPVLLAYLCIVLYARKSASGKTVDVWRNCGRVWVKTGLIILVIHIFLYVIYGSLLTQSISGLRSLQSQYREDVLGAKPKKTTMENITEIASSFRNLKRAITGKPSSSVDSTGQNDGATGAEQTASASTRPSSVKSREYKVVKFFYNGYAWLHHLFYVIVWLVLLIVFFFLPGLKMKNERTEI